MLCLDKCSEADCGSVAHSGALTRPGLVVGVPVGFPSA